MKSHRFLFWLIRIFARNQAISQPPTEQVTAIQYYFNTDPGVGVDGNGGIITVTPDADINETFSITVSNTLSTGFHNLYIRAKDEHGRWSLAVRKPFIIQSLNYSENIVAYQYFFDADPGVGVAGNGAVVPITPTSDLNTTLAISLPSLTPGFHNLYIRMKDISGQWSLTERRPFIIQPVATTENIVAYQYYFDTHPGVCIA